MFLHYARKAVGRAALGAAVLVTIAGCGGEDSESTNTDVGGPGGGASGCEAGQRDVAGMCVAAGIQDDGCPAGEVALGDGACRPAGIPTEMCADGFEPEGADGCRPILPDAPCTDGKMATPGERACRDVAPCGSGTWGDIPVDADTVFVDASYVGPSDGTAGQPWTTIQEAVDAARPSAIVAIAAGTYIGSVLVSKNIARS